MIKLLTAAEMHRDDNAEIAAGTPSRTLMERAAEAVLRVLQLHFDTRRVLVLCGAGNNGGDGFAVARKLREQGGDVRICYPGALQENGRPDTTRMSAECAYQYGLLPNDIPLDTQADVRGVTVVVDALFGIGLVRPIAGAYADAVTTVNASSLPVLAVDIPSGVNADTGEVMGVAIRATQTLAIAALKRGHLLYPGTLLCGKCEVADIGISLGESAAYAPEQGDLSLLPARPPRAHKGTFGRTLIVGGSMGMAGAAYLAAKAAYRTGCGIVEILAPEENRTIHQIQLPEAVLTCYTGENARETFSAALKRADAVAIGMGLGQGEVARILTEAALCECTVPTVIDADALNVIAADPTLMAALYARTTPTVITPHLGEMSRLCGIAVPAISRALIENAASFAQNAGVVTVLKDARTVTTDGEHHYLNTFGNSGMATGGCGDVLSGVIASLLAQGKEALSAAWMGVLMHAVAGDMAAEKQNSRSIMASDLLDGLCHLSSI